MLNVYFGSFLIESCVIGRILQWDLYALLLPAGADHAHGEPHAGAVRWQPGILEEAGWGKEAGEDDRLREMKKITAKNKTLWRNYLSETKSIDIFRIKIFSNHSYNGWNNKVELSFF